jgi:hypothetical protein
MGTLADSKAAWLAQYGYTGSLSDMEYQYYSNPPEFDVYGFVRVASPAPAGVLAPITNLTHHHRVIEGGILSKIRIGIATASGNICVAVYKNTGSGLSAKPGTRVATSGSIPCPAANINVDVSVGASVTVAAGDWLSFGADNAVVTLAGNGGAGDYGAGCLGRFAYDAAFPAPATSSPNMNNSRMFSMIGIP